MASATATPLYPVLQVPNDEAAAVPAAPIPVANSGAPKPDPKDKERLWRMGETEKLRSHINAGGTAVQDEAQTPNVGSFCMGDFVTMIELLFLAPFLLFAYFMQLLFTLPALIVVRIYLIFLPRPTNNVGTGIGFSLIGFIVLCLLAPALMMALLCIAFDLMVAWGVGFIYSTITCRWSRVFKGWQHLQPYRGGPRLRWFEVVRAVMGAMHRQGFLEFWPRFCSMLVLVPVLKWVVASNALTYDVEELFVTQRTIAGFAHEGLDSKTLAETFNLLVATAKHKESNRSMIDGHPFAPHYPNPHHLTRKWHQGMQFHNMYSLLVHTTHAPEEERSLALSKESAQDGHLVTVMLWHGNPFHFLSGYVEVNMTVDYGLEHPMWLAVGKGYLPHKLMWNVDAFFHKYEKDVAAFIRANSTAGVSQA